MYRFLQKITGLAGLLISGMLNARSVPDTTNVEPSSPSAITFSAQSRQTDTTLHYAHSKLDNNQPGEAIRVLKQFIGDTSITNKDTARMQALLLLSEIYATTGNTEGAYTFHNLYKRAFDSIQQEAQSVFLDSLVTKDQLMEKEKSRLERKIILDREEAQIQKSRISIGIMLLLCISVCLILIVLWIMRRRQRQIMEKSRYRMLKEREMAQLNASLNAELAERAKIFERLKQRLFPQLDRLHHILNQLKDEDNPGIGKEVRDSAILLENIDQELENIFLSAHTHYTSGGLIDNLEAFLHTLKERERIELTCNERDQHLNPVIVHELLRVLQEFLQNAFKHTLYFKVSIDVHFTPHQVKVQMQSVSPWPGKAIETIGLGLNSIRQRVKKLNGAVHVDQSDRFIINLEIPVSG